MILIQKALTILASLYTRELKLVILVRDTVVCDNLHLFDLNDFQKNKNYKIFLIVDT